MSKGCPIPMGDGICGEPNSLEIISQFNRLFQDRLTQIEAQADGGCLMEKIKLQEEWIHDLTEQNNMLVRVVQQLESEAVDRVHQLEEKLQRSGQCLHEVMKKYREHNFAADLLSEPLQKITHFEDDTKNVIEFVRRIREEQQWSLDGLFFHNIRTADLMGTSNMYKLPCDADLEGREELRVKEGMIKELTDKVNYLESFGNPQELTRELHCRRQECETLQQEMADARQALAEEVATKHDQVMLLKKDLQTMQENCHKQTAFKEDIIRELRRELKQLKQQVSIPEKPLSFTRNDSRPDSPQNQPSCEPYIIVNHSSKKQPGRNTVIYINKDGSVRKKDHTEICSKCKSKLSLSNCKSENDLAEMKNALKPVTERSKLTNLSRRKTFVDRTRKIFDGEGMCCERNAELEFVPVKTHIDYLEKRTL